MWTQPAAGDAGGSLGAALCAYHMYFDKERPHLKPGTPDRMKGSYLGDAFSQQEIEERLTKAGAKFDVLSEEAMIQETAKAMAAELSVGWYQGRMEFGPRSLGARSIIADARSPKMQSALNLKIKYRESFRPFAPAVLREDVADWFEIAEDSPYMLLVAPVKAERRRAMTEEENKLFGIDKLNVPRSEIPAVTHVDYSARVQTIHESTNPAFHKLVTKFKELTGCPVVVNTSFNVRGEPIVHTPEDAFRCFMGTELDLLVVGNCVLRKENQNPDLKLDYKNAFELD
ncbi:MAG: carbamoyltransferase C-terminal domain-containing protein [Polyangiaceae bacterium]